MSSPKRTKIEQEDVLDLTLRPRTWDDYIGQDKIKQNVRIIIDAAKQRNEPSVEHILFYGNPGLGKTTLARLVAEEIGVDFRVTSGPAIERAGDLAAILTNLSDGSVLFIDECHRLNRTVEEYLYPALEDFKLNLILGKGPMARTMELKVPRFTLIGATTRLAAVSGPLRSRFGAIFGLNFYDTNDIVKILARSARLLNVAISHEALDVLAKSSRYTPRVANHLLKRVRDFAQVQSQEGITAEITRYALDNLEIDPLGLGSNDRRILEALIDKFNGGPAGIQALAAATAEEEETILDVYEPYLMRLGFIARTPRGRIATRLGFEHLNKKTPRGAIL
ncbi:MAG: Holliday junction branch migration DNA helicase RuvB [Candidatus Pacebacteria bacterium]|nr:Holliday junction branch migration DNA helicase RuvB [Candidatus Paceibacterota bacterium]